MIAAKTGSTVRLASCGRRSSLALPARRVGLSVRMQAVDLSTATVTYTNGSTNGSATAAAPAPPAPVVAPATPQVLPPADVYYAVAMDGKKKAYMDPLKTFLMALYAGAYIGFGGFLGTTIVNACPGLTATNPGLAKLLFALIFPVGLFMNTMHGTELFTGNTMKLPAAIFEGKATVGQLVKNWFWSYSGNFVGSLALVYLVVASGVLAGAAMPIKTALYKTGLTWTQAFTRAVLANWLVCVAVWCATSAQSLPGKIMGIWPPIATFVAIGLEHSVANMFLIPLGIALGADITFGHFITSNLIPVTLGNIVGGFVFMAISSGNFFGSLGKAKAA